MHGCARNWKLSAKHKGCNLSWDEVCIAPVDWLTGGPFLCILPTEILPYAEIQILFV
jgi:hypothetical protein